MTRSRGTHVKEDAMPRHSGPLTASAAPSLTGGNLILVVIVAVIAIGALAVAGYLVREVLAASEGSENMKRIAAAVQERAAAYLARPFRTLGGFAVVAFFLPLALPADNLRVRIGR